MKLKVKSKKSKIKRTVIATQNEGGKKVRLKAFPLKCSENKRNLHFSGLTFDFLLFNSVEKKLKIKGVGFEFAFAVYH